VKRGYGWKRRRPTKTFGEKGRESTYKRTEEKKEGKRRQRRGRRRKFMGWSGCHGRQYSQPLGGVGLSVFYATRSRLASKLSRSKCYSNPERVRGG